MSLKFIKFNVELRAFSPAKISTLPGWVSFTIINFKSVGTGVGNIEKTCICIQYLLKIHLHFVF